MALLAAVAAGPLLVLAAPATAHADSVGGIHVVGNQFVDDLGQPVRLIGVNRPGTSELCLAGGIFDGPTDDAAIATMAAWHVNSVRVDINEDCWLGLNQRPATDPESCATKLTRTCGVDPNSSGPVYRQAIADFVARLHNHGLYVILESPWSAQDGETTYSQRGMPDAAHAPDLWTSVASTFRNDPGVVFDVFNEPYGVSWECWRDGCDAPADPRQGDPGGWRTAGMQSLVDAIRSAGATQPIMLGGLDWGNDLSGWLQYEPVDPFDQVAASFHVYLDNPCEDVACWDATAGSVLQRVPVVTGEIGEGDCAHGFIDSYMAWADAHGVSYLAWAWYPADCGNFPSLIKNWDGDPTDFGIGFRDHLAMLAVQ